MKVIKISTTGWIYIVLTIFLGIAAINTGNNLVYLITSFLLGVMGASGYFGKTNISKLDIKIIPPEKIFAQNETIVRITLINKKNFFPSFLLKIETEYFNEIFTFVDSNNISTKSATIVFPKRGYNYINIIKISSKFPFNFFERYAYLNKEIKFLIYPEPIKKSLLFSSNFNKRKGFDDFYTQLGERTNDINYIRNFLYGDNFKFIHWKLSAKLDRLMIKEFLKSNEDTFLIDFNEIPINNLELKISALTFLIINRKNIALKINGKILYNSEEILTFLALY